MTLEETLAQIKPLDKNAMDVAAKRWDSIAKPLHSLGKMEKLVIQIAGITGNPDIKIQKRALVAMCADNGVVEEGVTPVSYTHLDVYKRQDGQNCSVHCELAEIQEELCRMLKRKSLKKLING